MALDPDKEQAKILYVDFGYSDWVNEKYIRRIKDEFLILPFQAVECYLEIKPARDNIWVEASRSYFKNSVNGKLFWARIIRKNVDQSIVIELFDSSSGDDHVSVGRNLINLGYAVKNDDTDVLKDCKSFIPG